MGPYTIYMLGWRGAKTSETGFFNIINFETYLKF